MIIAAVGRYFFWALLLLGLSAMVVSYQLWRGNRVHSRPSRTASLFGLLVMLFAIAVLVLSTTIAHTNNSSGCRGCHEMEPEYRTWKASSHSKVECLACHLEPRGVPDLLKHDVLSLSEVWNHYTGDYPKILNRDSELSQKEMRSSECLRCHNSPGRRDGKIRIDHQAHARLGIQCQICHNRLAHRGARSYPYLDGVKMMSGCMRCHLPGKEKEIKGEKAPSACSTCHAQPGFGKLVFGAGTIDADSLDDCQACHRLRDPETIKQFATTKMFKEGVDCSDCHNTHLKKFVPDPQASVCRVCHAKAAKQLITGREAHTFKPEKPN